MLIAAKAAVAAALTVAPTPPSPDPAIEAVVLEAFTAHLDAEGIVDYASPACAWSVAAEDPATNELWTCYVAAEGVYVAPVFYYGDTGTAEAQMLIKYVVDPTFAG